MSFEKRNEYWGQQRRLGSEQERNQHLAQNWKISKQGVKALYAKTEEAE